MKYLFNILLLIISQIQAQTYDLINDKKHIVWALSYDAALTYSQKKQRIRYNYSINIYQHHHHQQQQQQPQVRRSQHREKLYNVQL